MFVLVLLCCVLSVVNCASFNGSLNSEFRVKRNANHQCGVAQAIGGLASVGQQIRRGDYPWLVAIWLRLQNQLPSYICEGTLISARKVVTAAHCLHNKGRLRATKPENILLMIGAFNLLDSYEPRLQVVPSGLEIHEDWNPFVKRFHDDIAILILENDVSFTDFIRPICLFEHTNFSPTEGIVVGWGKWSTKFQENVPRMHELPIAESNAECYRENSALAILGSRNSFCAGKPGVGVCLGDTGSGFFIEVSNRFYLKGIVSSSVIDSSGCYTENYAIYTDVPNYVKWIENTDPKATLKKDVLRDIDEICGIPMIASGLISGGQQIKRGTYPWMVAIWLREENKEPRYICSGNLFSAREVVTAANCLQNKGQTSATKPKDLLLMFGAFNLTDSFEPRVEVVPLEVKIHEDWDPLVQRFNEDIAIITLEEDVQFTKYIRPICLMSLNVKVPEAGIVVGWGKSENTVGFHENIPRSLRIPIVSNEQCYLENPSYGKIASMNTFCAGKPGVGVCLGDSGSGFFIKIGNRFYLKGIVSTSVIDSSGCYTENYAIYTDVPKYTDWIEKEALQPTSTVSTTPSVSHVPTTKSSQTIFEADCGKISSVVGLVIGGNAARYGQWPFLVSLARVDDKSHFCGGSLITNQHVLTAAQCLQYKDHKYILPVSKLIVNLGKHNLSATSETNSVVRNVKESFIHPDWNYKSTRFDADLAILLLDEPVEFSSVIKPVCLPQSWDIFKTVEEGTVVGWGKSKSRDMEDSPRAVRLKIINDAHCYRTDQYVAKISTLRTFCAGGSGAGPCLGDTGGGLYTKVGDSWNLRGIVSASVLTGLSCDVNRFAVYTKVSEFFDWISDIVSITTK